MREEDQLRIPVRSDDEEKDPGNEEAGEEENQLEQLHALADQLENDKQELLSKMKYLQADFDNYKKRCAKEKREITALASERVVRELLSLLDDFERALLNSGVKAEDPSIQTKGLEIMYNRLREILAREGVTLIDTGCKLDPFQHEVVTRTDEPGLEDNEIVDCLQKGYMMGDKVIRPAKVVVCRRSGDSGRKADEPVEECPEDPRNDEA